MAGQRLTDKTVTDRTASDDLYMVVDVSDTTGSAEGTSKAITADYVVQTTTTVEIDNTEFMALGTTGKVIVPAVAGTVIVPIAIYLEYYEGATANTNTLNARMGFIDQSADHFWDEMRFFASSTYNAMSWMCSGGQQSFKGLLQSTTPLGLPLYFYFGTNPSASSTGTVKIWTTYRRIKLL